MQFIVKASSSDFFLKKDKKNILVCKATPKIKHVLEQNVSVLV